MWYVFWMRWRSYCCSISFSHSSFSGVGCIIWISNTILGKHMNVKMVFMLISICWWYIYVNVLEDSTFFRWDKRVSLYTVIQHDSQILDGTQFFGHWQQKSLYFFFLIKLDFFYCVREKNNENFSTRKFCTAQMWDEIVHLTWFFQSCKTFGFHLNYLVYSDLIYHFNV